MTDFKKALTRAFNDLRRTFLTDSYVAAVARGDIAGATAFRGYGERDNVNGSNIDIWVGTAPVQPEPETGGYGIAIKCTDADDTGGGSGVQSIIAHYIDLNGIEQTASATTAGLTNSSFGVTAQFVQHHHATKVGSTGVAEGNISIINETSSAVVSQMASAGNFSLSAMRYVPAGKVLYIYGWHSSGAIGAGGKVAKIRLRATSDDEANLYTGVYLFRDVAVIKDSAQSIKVWPPLKIPAGATVKISGWTTGAMDLAGTWFGILEDA